jgi:signal transduction histidine kinase
MRPIADTVAAGWPLSAALALALAGQQVWLGRRRETLNRALHELRRPLQALALATPGPRLAGSPIDLAMTALARLDAEVNGGIPTEPRPPGRCRDVVEAAVVRWRSRAALAGSSIELRWRGPEGVLVAAPAAVTQAVENLVVNAIEHGGPTVVVEGSAARGRVRIRVADSGRATRDAGRRETPAEAIARLTGRRRRGHGLAVVREVASEQGGRFALRPSERGSVAVLELPVATDPGMRAA